MVVSRTIDGWFGHHTIRRPFPNAAGSVAGVVVSRTYLEYTTTYINH